MKIVAIIPARGGSKSIPRKNIKTLSGKPLISYPIEAAKKCDKLNKIIVSTDDKEIASIARKYGAEIIDRPKNLADDKTPTMPVLIHAVKELEKQNFKPDVIILLYATSPLISFMKIKEAIEKLESGADSVISVCKDSSKIWGYKNSKPVPLLVTRENRQSVIQYRENGALYAVKYNILMKGSFIGNSLELLEMNEEESIDINTDFDFKLAEFLLSKK